LTFRGAHCLRLSKMKRLDKDYALKKKSRKSITQRKSVTCRKNYVVSLDTFPRKVYCLYRSVKSSCKRGDFAALPPNSLPFKVIYTFIMSKGKCMQKCIGTKRHNFEVTVIRKSKVTLYNNLNSSWERVTCRNIQRGH
jgi:hypothetical protein